MTMSVRPLHIAFVAEIEGIDLRQPQPPAIVDELVAAADHYAVLIYPEQDIEDDQQLAFGGCFGPLETATFINLKDRDHSRRHKQMNYVSNLDPEGRMLPQDDRVRMYQLANRLWHTDSSFKAVPGRYSLLHAARRPAGGRRDRVRGPACSLRRAARGDESEARGTDRAALAHALEPSTRAPRLLS